MKSQKRWLFVCCWLLCVVGWCLPMIASAWTPFVVDGRCKKSRRFCTATVGNRGGAGACCDPSSADIQTCTTDNECIGTYRYAWEASKRPLKWNLSPNNMPGTLGYDNISVKQIEDECKRAFDVWSKPACTTFRSAYQGQTTGAPGRSDAIVTIYLPTASDWARLGAFGALAFATPYSDTQGNIIDADIYVSPEPRGGWGVSPVSSQKIDFFHTITHEIGHTLGLGHSFSSANVMYYSSLGPGPEFKGLSADDIAGICSLYPATNSCKADADCAPCYQCLSGTCTAPSFDTATNCKACKVDADCGSNASCVAAPEGKRCLLKCFGDCCPNGYQCQKIGAAQLCVPFSSHCPNIQCASDATCGADSVCTSNVCEAPPLYDYKQCATSCTTDADCTSPYECATYGAGKQQCTLPCPNYMCPIHMACRQTQQGQHCLPLDTNYCACRRNTDCTQGKQCEEDSRVCSPGLGCFKRCISVGGGDVGEPCNIRNPNCAAGLRCERLATGTRCIQECATQACPAGFTCVKGGVNLCMKEQTRSAGESCDGLFFRCLDGLSCENINDGSTFCVETCSVSSACTLGGKCGLIRSPQFCECSEDADCSVGFGCVALVGGASVCQCTKPPCQVPCGNGICESGNGENCDTCAKDCACEAGFTCTEGFCKPTTRCGDGACEADKGENCGDCPQDCRCGFGSVCAQKKCVSPFCGDGMCQPDRSENCERCPEDCGCKAPERCLAAQCTATDCGDGTCDAAKGEDCSSCPSDCQCPSSQQCQNKQCVVPGTCGDGTCDAAKGEDCLTCTADCGCTNRNVCDKGTCVSADTFCPPAQQQITCETGDRNCKVVCQPGGCGCQQTSHTQMPLWLLVLMCFWGLRVVRRPTTIA